MSIRVYTYFPHNNFCSQIKDGLKNRDQYGHLKRDKKIFYNLRSTKYELCRSTIGCETSRSIIRCETSRYKIDYFICCSMAIRGFTNVPPTTKLSKYTYSYNTLPLSKL